MEASTQTGTQAEEVGGVYDEHRVCPTCQRDDGWSETHLRNYQIKAQLKPEYRLYMSQNKTPHEVCGYCYPGDKLTFRRTRKGGLTFLWGDILPYPRLPLDFRCKFCDAQVHGLEAPYHFDNLGLCGLRKTTLFGRCLSVIHNVIAVEDPRQYTPFYHTIINYFGSNQTPDGRHIDQESVSHRLLNGRLHVSMSKPVLFEDEYKLRIEYGHSIRFLEEIIKQNKLKDNQQQQQQ